ncbi:hypothetical protein IVG45_06125 [Methylomonas sp. LL1]|uniref:hypothetical protein n=1 Tax=Methylomonas sp. LL1 TaxID=2785785 RepID=UPI0018C3A3F4|nr:hypothetical protein [Methylomonas sp. LL1]QPK64532.1 hypothetical protein IVG45_06125 [Methylomonas sp. LL1]
MKHFSKIVIFSTLLPLSFICGAEQPKEPATSGGKAMAPDPGGMDPAKMEQHMKDMQEHSLMMHDLSNKILAETDPQKQQALKDQQLELMKAQHMKMMSGHSGKPMDHKKMQ